MCIHKLAVYIVGLALSVGLMSEKAFAHGHGHEGHEAELQALAELFEEAVQFEAALFPAEDTSAARLDPRWSRQQALIDSGAWRLMTGWARAYYRDLHKDCPEDHGLNEADFLRELEQEAARGGMIRRFHAKLVAGVGGLAQESADIGARLGRTALIVKIAAEVAETVLSKAVGGGGVHVICTVIDAALLFWTRHVQTAYRTMAWAPQLNQSGFMASLRMAYVHNRAKRLFRKVRLVAGPIELDEHELEEVDEEGPNRWWGFVSEGKRARMLYRLAEKSEKSPDARATLVSKFKEFNGSRLGRYLWLKARRRGHAGYLKGQAPMDSVLDSKQGLWILALQEGLLNRTNALVNKTPENFEFASVEPRTPVVAGLIGELNESLSLRPAQKDGLGLLLNDIEYIFDPTQNYQSRFVRVTAIESLLTVFIYRLLKASWDESGESEVKSWSDVLATSHARWVQGRFVSIVHEFADYLSLGAVAKDSRALVAAKYASQDFMIKIFSHLQIVLAKQQGLLNQDELQLSLTALNNSRPWIDRSSSDEGWFFWKKAPLCESL